MNFLDFILKKLEKKKCNEKRKIDNKNTNRNSEL